MGRKEYKDDKIKHLEKIADKITWWIGSIPSLIAHSLVFLISFLLPILDIVSFDKMLLILTTVLSLEAIYLAIFIQMAVNRSHEKIEFIQEDIEEISEDIEDIQEDIEEISEDIEEITEDIEDIQEDIEEINEEDDDENHAERAKNTMLKNNVSTNKNEIKELKNKIVELQSRLDELVK